MLNQELTKISIHALVNSGSLERIGEELIEPDETSVRSVYATDEFSRWREDDLPYMESHGRSDLSPDEEVDDFLRRFQLGKSLTDIARLSPTSDGVWEVKLQQLRLTGWFVARDELVLAAGEDADALKSPGKPTYGQLRRFTLGQRENLGLDYVKGDQRDVISHQTSKPDGSEKGCG
ncbi:MAG: hypothetical protein IE921_13935 [Rhodobacteraceae bacterium]|nr:hypothetical protein [Paracoccaceae bacterium]